MKKVLTIALALLPILAFSQIKYDSVRVVKPQNFVEALSIDTAIMQIISQKVGVNRRINFQTAADWILAQQPNLDSAQFVSDTLLLFYGSDTIVIPLPPAIDSVTYSGDTLRVYSYGDEYKTEIIGGDGNGLFDASNNNDTIRVSTALLRAAFQITGGAYGMTITSSSTPITATSTGTTAGVFTGQNAGTNAYLNTMDIIRLTSGTAAAGLGSRIRFSLEADNGASSIAGYLGVKWSSAAAANPSSDFQVRLLGAGTEYDRLTLAGDDGQLTLSGYANNAMNNVDSSLYILAVDATGDVHTRAASGLGGDGNGIYDGDGTLPSGATTVRIPTNQDFAIAETYADGLADAYNLNGRPFQGYAHSPYNWGYFGLWAMDTLQRNTQYVAIAPYGNNQVVMYSTGYNPNLTQYSTSFEIDTSSILISGKNNGAAFAYNLPHISPSATAGDTSVMVWAGYANPFFMDKSDFGGGADTDDQTLSTSNDTLTISGGNAVKLPITELLRDSVTTTTMTVDLETRYQKVVQIDMTTATNLTLTINNPTDAGVYTFHFLGVSGTDNVTWPAAFYDANNTALGTDALTAGTMYTCYYSSADSKYFCK